jgi:hypothetical protein
MEKSQKETVISNVFMDVKSTTTRQIPFINALFVRKVLPEFYMGETLVGSQIITRCPTIDFSFAAFWNSRPFVCN